MRLRRGIAAAVAVVDAYVLHLRRYRAISIDVGDRDGLRADTQKLHDEIDKSRVAHMFEIYPGTHIRFQDRVIRFFSGELAFEVRS